MAQPDVYTRTTFFLFTLIYSSTGLVIGNSLRSCPMILLDKSTWDALNVNSQGRLNSDAASCFWTTACLWRRRSRTECNRVSLVVHHRPRRSQHLSYTTLLRAGRLKASSEWLSHLNIQHSTYQPTKRSIDPGNTPTIPPSSIAPPPCSPIANTASALLSTSPHTQLSPASTRPKSSTATCRASIGYAQMQSGHCKFIDGYTIVGVIGTTSRLEIGMGQYDYVRGGVGGLGG